VLSGFKLFEENLAEIECVRVVAMATNFGTKIAITGFVRTIATRHLVMKEVYVVVRQNADIASTLHLRDVAMAIIFWLSMYGVHIGATWRMRLNYPCVVAMGSYVKFFLLPVIVLLFT